MTGLGLTERSRSQRTAQQGTAGFRVWFLRMGVASLACVSALAISACDVRLETDPVIFPSADAATLERDSLANAEAVVLAAASDAGTSADDVAVDAAVTAQTHLKALGGVYVAYPGTTPSPTPSPGAARPSLTEAIDAVRTTAESVAATTTDANLAFLARSITLDWALRELWAERSTAQAAADEAAAATAAQIAASGTPYPTESAAAPSEPSLLPGDQGEAPFPLADGTTPSAAGFAPTSASATGLTTDQLIALAVAEDEARFAYQTMAALEFGTYRDDALSRARLHGARSDAVASLVTWDAAVVDPRTPLYQLRDANLQDPESRLSLACSIEIDLGARYAALLDGASADDATWILNAAFDAYANAMATGGFTTADLPTLPGLVVGP